MARWSLIFMILCGVMPLTAVEQGAESFVLPRYWYEPAQNFDSNPLINLLPEDTVVWETVEGAFSYKREPVAVVPYALYDTLPLLEHYERIGLYTKGVQRETYLQPFQSFRSTVYFASEDTTLYGKAGLKLDKGFNGVLTEDGNLSVMNRFGAYWSFRHRWSAQTEQNELHRLYAKGRLGKFSIEGGRDSVNFGPGEWGLLLSSNAEPFWMIKFQNEEAIEFYGKWSFVLLNGWLMDERGDHSDPKLFAARVTYQPAGWVEIGVTRTELYGGEGRPTYQIHEMPEVIFGGKDNVPGGRFDNDGYAALDFTFSLPMDRWTGGKVKSLRFYFQEAGTDIAAPWQPEDRIFTVPWLFFHFFERAYLMGFTMSLEDHFFRLEYAKTALSFYRHHLYPQDGYTYRGLSLGYPFGRNFQSIFFKHRWNAADWLTLEYRVGLHQLPAHSEADHKKEFALDPMFTVSGGVTRYWGEATLTFPVKNLFFELYGRVEGGDAYDADPDPISYTIVRDPRVTGIAGFSIGAKF
ncbi:MAG TPA: capsule assembly Wzi family protein [bacterium]|nr:capsule assembly Wzi family protein [bacterium]